MYHRFYLLFCSFSTFAFAGRRYDFSTLNVTEQLEQPAFRGGFPYQSPLYLSPVKNGKVLIQFFFDYYCRVCSFAQDILSLYSQLNQEKVILRISCCNGRVEIFSQHFLYATKYASRRSIK